MAGIEDLIEVYRGENIKLNPFRKRSSSSYAPKYKSKVGRYVTTSPRYASSFASKFPNVVKSTKITPAALNIGKKLFDKAHFFAEPSSYYGKLQILSKKNKEKLKVNILKTIASNAKALTPLALKGLSVVASLPAQVVVMTLSPTVANADEVNMTLEDFAKLAKENQPKEKMATGGKAYSTDIKDYYRRSLGVFKEKIIRQRRNCKSL